MSIPVMEVDMFRSLGPPFSTAVVLCIDDNQDVLECEREFLEAFGYTVLTASSGGQGLELASTLPVDVVVLDYFMPTMNGEAVAMEMKRLRLQAPIILLTETDNVPPDPTLNLVDALVAKDRLSSQLLPTIAYLQDCGLIPPPFYDA